VLLVAGRGDAHVRTRAEKGCGTQGLWQHGVRLYLGLLRKYKAYMAIV